MARYPAAAQRGLQHLRRQGPLQRLPPRPQLHQRRVRGRRRALLRRARAASTRADYGGIAALRASPFNLLGPYNDDPGTRTGVATRHVEQLHRNWGEFRVPSLRNVARTAPYMHNGSLATLADVVRHYSEVDEERLHGTPGQRLVRPLRLSPQERADLVAFLETLSAVRGDPSAEIPSAGSADSRTC